VSETLLLPYQGYWPRSNASKTRRDWLMTTKAWHLTTTSHASAVLKLSSLCLLYS